MTASLGLPGIAGPNQRFVALTSINIAADSNRATDKTVGCVDLWEMASRASRVWPAARGAGERLPTPRTGCTAFDRSLPTQLLRDRAADLGDAHAVMLRDLDEARVRRAPLRLLGRIDRRSPRKALLGERLLDTCGKRRCVFEVHAPSPSFGSCPIFHPPRGS